MCLMHSHMTAPPPSLGEMSCVVGRLGQVLVLEFLFFKFLIGIKNKYTQKKRRTLRLA